VIGVLQRVDVGRQRLDADRASASGEVIAELHALAAPLAGARVLHVNATPLWRDVAEILRSQVPLLDRC